MPVNLQAPDHQRLFPVPGVELGIAMAGVRKANRRDLTVVTIAEGATAAGVFTANRFCAAPVQLCRTHLAASASPRAMLINTGNATAADIEGLAEEVRRRVYETSGIVLEWEIRRIGRPIPGIEPVTLALSSPASAGGAGVRAQNDARSGVEGQP